MSLLLRAAAVAAFLLPLAALPTSAQNYRGAWGIYGGGSWFSDLNDGADDVFDDDFDFIPIDGDFIIIDDDFFIPSELGFADLSLENGWIAGTQAEYWFGRGRFGLRLNGSYTERSFELDDVDEFVEVIDGFDDFFVLEDDDTFGDVNTWFGDLDVLVRLLRPEPDRKWAPFVGLGGGFVIYNPAGHNRVVVPIANAQQGDGRAFDIDDDDFDDDDGNSKTRFAIVPSIGLDYLPNLSLGNIDLGLRLELADHYVFDSPMEPLFREVIDVATEDTVFLRDDDFDGVHNVRLTLGVYALFGRLFEPPRAQVAPAPPPPAPAPIEEETVTICAIEPTTTEGLDMINAIYVPSTNDTLVTVNGDRVNIDDATRNVMVASESNWFVRGAPLTITVDNDTTEYVTFGGARIVTPDDLTYLGTVAGLGVYADEDEVRAINPALLDLGPGNLESTLAQNEDLLADFEQVEVLYVPLEPTGDASGCVFQPVRRVEEVRKVRG